jgi:3-hydroxybutyryl-CoA dehydrogenase
VSAAGDANQQAFANYLKEHLLDQGKLGVESGEGFYRYAAHDDHNLDTNDD